MSAPSVSVSSLRQHLLNALSTLPGSRTFHLHLLASIPRRPAKSPFLYAEARPKCFVQDLLILLSEETIQVPEKSSFSVDTSMSGSSYLAPRVFVSAIEASVYLFPASGSTVLYISKVDGTGQGIFPSPTSTLLRAFLLFYASFQSPLYAFPIITHHLWIHLFARSQRQYLFPNSADHPNKRPLSDVALCKWWKRVLSEVVATVEATDGPEIANKTRNIEHSIHLYHILPGQTELDASYLLRDTYISSTLLQTPWRYAHPYNIHTETEIPFPSATASQSIKIPRPSPPLASLIPHFEDDPKSRFLDELAATSEEQTVAVPVPTPHKKRQKIGEGTEMLNTASGIEKMDKQEPSAPGTANDENSIHALETTEAALGQSPSGPAIVYIPPTSSPPHTSPPSPLARPSTPKYIKVPQNTMLSPYTPNVTGIPLSNSISQAPSTNALPRTPQTPRTPRRPKSDLDAISPAEFWERISFRQECAVGAVTAFFVAVFSRHSVAAKDVHPRAITPSPTVSSDRIDTSPTNDAYSTLLSRGTIPHQVLKRVMTSLLTGVEFSTTERAQRGTYAIETAIKGLCQGTTEGDSIKRNSSMSDMNLNDVHLPTLDLYALHVHACLSTSNPPFTRKSRGTADVPAAFNSTVNVLGVRRKKRE